MMFWLVAALVLVAVLLPLVRAVMAPPAVTDTVQADVAFFHAQEAEIDRLAAAGAMTAEEAKAGRAEAARKLLAKARQDAGQAAAPAGRSILLPALLVALVPALALPLYLRLGAPSLPDAPFAARTDISRAEQDLTRLVARLDAHLAESPNDLRGLEIALPVYMRLGRYDDAAAAAEKIAGMKPDSAEAHANHAEALIFAGSGQVSDEARGAIGKALALNPKLPRARFYSGLAAEQAGKPDEALAIWRMLEADLADGMEKQAVAAQIARLGKGAPHPPRGPAGSAPAPDKDAGEAIRAMPEAEQKQAIRAMVDSLEQRLVTGGGSPDEWQRLIRALTVLGEKARASAALKAAVQAHGQDAAATAALTALARELGVEGTAQ